MTDYKNVIYSFVSYRRNIKDMPFVNKLTDTEQAIGVCRSMSEIFGDDYEFKMLKKISLEQCLKLEENDLITKDLIENKDISAFANNGQGQSILINEEDHIRLICKKENYCLEECFSKANQMDDMVLDKLEVCFNNNLGYLTANPFNAGTGMEVGCLVFLPALYFSGNLNKILKELESVNYQFLNINGSNFNYKNAFVLIKNKYTFGYKENQIAQGLQKLVDKIISLEYLEENNLFNLSASIMADKIFRTYGILTSCYRITEEEAVEHLGIILWGINLKMLKFTKKFDIYSFIAKIKENHLKSLGKDIKEIEKLRAKVISNKICECIVKGDVDV